MPLTALDICTDALREIGVLGAIDPALGEDAAFVLGKLNRILDNWNAERQAVYESVFASYTLTPALQPHTIGPTGTFVVTQRPQSIEAANLVDTTVTPNVRFPLALRDDAWWAAVPVQATTGTYPTDLVYSPSWPNGELTLYPVPTAALGLELLTRLVLADVTLTTAFSMPPGYRDALILTLAEDCLGAYGRPVPPMLPSRAATARHRILVANTEIPVLKPRDSGMPGGQGYFNWMTGRNV